MTQVTIDQIPSLDLNDFINGNETDKKRFVEKLGEAYSQIGFVAIKNHYLKVETQTGLYASCRRLFYFRTGCKR